MKKSGDSDGDEADFYGSNAAIFAQNGAELTISNAQITTDGKHANAVFSYGEGTVINISDSQIDTNQATSGGIMVTGGGILNATNLTITTQSGSSAPIRSDRGGGQLNVNGGTYKSYGSGSPAIYSTADIPVYEECEAKLAGKRIGLFGSYGWGDGEWMRTWEDNCKNAGAIVVSDAVICVESPDENAVEQCKKLGAALA